MASFGTGIAIGELHEMTDITMAAELQNVSIHRLPVRSDPDKQTSIVSVNNHDTGDQSKGESEMIVKVCTEDNDDSLSNSDVKNCKSHTLTLEEKTKEAMDSDTFIEYIHPTPVELIDQKSDIIAADNESKVDINLELTEDIISEFDKHVESKRTSAFELQPDPFSPTSRQDSNKTITITNEDSVSKADFTIATYTSTKTAEETTDRHTPVTKTKDKSGLSSRQTTNSSAGARADSQSESSMGKPDSGYGKRRQRRGQKDIRSTHSRQRDRPRVEAVGALIIDEAEPTYKGNDDYLNDRFQSPRQPYEDGATQKTLLELMTRGLGNFTEQMATVMIEKIRPEYESLSRQVAKEVQEATMYELKELREKIINAQKALKDLEKEKDHTKKLLEAEKNKRIKEFEEKEVQIKKLEKDLEQAKATLKERDRLVKKAEHRAKAEEQKRVELEQEYQEKCNSLKRLLDRAKGDLLVYRSKKRIALTVEKHELPSLTNRLNSHH